MSGSRVGLCRRHRMAVFGVAIAMSAAVVGVSPAGARSIGHGVVGGARVMPLVGATVSVSPGSLLFPTQRAGTYSGVARTVTVTNTGAVPVMFTNLFTTTNDYFGGTTCFDHPSLAVGLSCAVSVFFIPNASGPRPATLEIVDNAAGSPQKVGLSGNGVEGYFLADSHGRVASFGDGLLHGDASGLNLASPIISMKATGNGDGYWLLGSDGGIFSYGNAAFYGSTGNIHLNQPVVGMERTVDGKGYWLVASDGGIFSYGDAAFYGSTGNIHLNQPVVGMARTPSGHGYWLVARDGGIFSYGDAKFYGSTGNIHLNQPIVGMTTRPNSEGYWMYASDGGIFSFGDAPFFGSVAGGPPTTVTGMATTPDGGGYWLVSNSGGVSNYGNAAFLGDLHTTGSPLAGAIGITPTSPPLPPELVP